MSELLGVALGPGWRVDFLRDARPRPDGLTSPGRCLIRSRGRHRIELDVLRFGRFEPAHARQLVAMVRAGAAVAGSDPRKAAEVTLVIARSISDAAQAVLADARMQCADERGRIDISLPAHGVLIRHPPDPSASVAAKRRRARARSLSGPRAQRVAEVLCENALPLSVMRVSAKAQVSRGYVSRVIAFLAAEDLVRHMPYGSVVRPTPRVGMVSSRACVDCLAGPEPMRVTGEWLLRRLCDPERTSEVAKRIAWLDARDAELRAMRRRGVDRK